MSIDINLHLYPNYFSESDKARDVSVLNSLASMVQSTPIIEREETFPTVQPSFPTDQNVKAEPIPAAIVPEQDDGISIEQITQAEVNAGTLEDLDAPEQFYGELDARGFPWDERIHASSKAINADGTWKKRRGVNPKEVEQIEAELILNSPEEPAASPEIPSFNEVGAMPSFNYEPPTMPSFAPPATVAEAPATVAEAPASTVTFPILIQRIQKGVVANEISNDQVQAVLNNHGVAGTAMLAPRRDLIPTVYAELFPNG